MLRHYRRIADLPECPHAAQQRRGDEWHVPGNHEHGRATRGTQRCFESGKGPKTSLRIRENRERRKPFRGIALVADDELRVGGTTQHREHPVRDADAVDRRQPLRHAIEAARLSSGEQDANTPGALLMLAQMRRPRNSAARSSSAVMARSTSSGDVPRRGRSFMKRLHELHITRS